MKDILKNLLQQVERLKKMENKKIPENIDYDAIIWFCNRSKSKIKRVRPLSIAQASRISGVNPADVSIFLFILNKEKLQEYLVTEYT